MFWDKKDEKKGLPELPPIKSFGSFGMPKREEMPKEISSESEEPQDFEEELPELPDKFRFPKIEETKMPEKKMTSEFTPAAKSEDVYVKIDRFHSARKALNSAQIKLKEIDETMKKIRETRIREEQELSFW